MVETENYTISESFTLPSQGKIYSEPINPEIELRSMTTRDEMRRTSPSENAYKPLCEMVEGCIVGKKPRIHVYDMALGDFIFLLHKLRIVTYGGEYHLKIRCPNCDKVVEGVTDLNDEQVIEWDDKILENIEFVLPKTQHKIRIKFTTPRMLDEIQAEKNRRMKNASADDLDPSLTLTVQALIDTVDGEKLSPGKLETFVETLPGYDLKYLMHKSQILNEGVGLDTKVMMKCGRCGYDVVTTFRIEPEFFDPVIN